ncbi:hypothetical protein [Actinoplanes sp. DH11]|uniref:hypothetical protein n=1 Tax=Actinoplanes sp. DH11 TaxID=2857011 RepID=UPI001E540DB9|nr:hypothetical protein [Actinoplanes sp. DH11]
MTGTIVWDRIEPHARTADPGIGLAAAVADPLWFLARQWQLGELTGSDGGTAVLVDVQTSWSRFTRYLPQGSASTGATVDLDPGRPLEALVEQEPELVYAGAGTWRARVRAGRDLTRALHAAGLNVVAGRLRGHAGTRFDPPPVTGVEGPVDQRYRTLLHGATIDGAAILRCMATRPAGTTPTAGLPAEILAGLAPDDVSRLDTLIGDWSVRARNSWGLADVNHPEAAPAWVNERLEYAFTIAAPPLPGRTEELVLQAGEYDGDGLDWYALDRATPEAVAALGPVPPRDGATGTAVSTALAAPITFPGAPSDRFWELEDGAVSLTSGSGPTGLVKMAAVEFATVYSPDWLLAPVPVPVGCVAALDWVIVRDTFGVATVVSDATTRHGDIGLQFQPSAAPRPGAGPQSDTGPDGDEPLLVVLPSALGALRSAPRERVTIQRDEMANLAWAMEHTVVGPAGLGVEQNRPPGDTDLLTPATTSAYELIWRLATPVPSTWIPMIADAGRMLVRARLLDTPTGSLRAARSRIMADLRRLHEEEVTGAGCAVTMVDQLARGYDGRHYSWRGRVKQAGSGNADSGLRFDTTNPPR